MDVLRSFSPKKKATKSSISSQSAASVHKVGKPFSAMTAEDLIQCLPECSPSMIANTWVPAMVREHRKIKNLLQEAATIKTDANAELRDLGAVSMIASTIFEVDLSVMQEIESISNDARKICNNYEQALLRAESHTFQPEAFASVLSAVRSPGVMVAIDHDGGVSPVDVQ
jgi:hypothetical protein